MTLLGGELCGVFINEDEITSVTAGEYGVDFRTDTELVGFTAEGSSLSSSERCWLSWKIVKKTVYIFPSSPHWGIIIHSTISLLSLSSHLK